MYKLTFYSYCGMAGIPASYDDKRDARDAAAAIIARRRRAGLPVQTIMPGAQWEVLEPDNAAMVPDACGTLYLERVTFECAECGTPCETRDDAAACCAECDAPAPDDCAECARAHGPHYAGPCEH